MMVYRESAKIEMICNMGKGALLGYWCAIGVDGHSFTIARIFLREKD